MKKINQYWRRIKSQKEITTLLRTGTKCKSAFFTLIFRKNSQHLDRMAVLVSKKNGSAVKRNRIKRIAREFFYKTNVVSAPFYDIIIFPHYSSSEKLNTVKKKYESWRNTLKK